MGELTAPKSAPSHSFRRVSTVLAGSAAPVFWKVSKPACKSTKLKERLNRLEIASRTRRPAFGGRVRELGGLGGFCSGGDFNLPGSPHGRCRRRG